MLGQRYGYRPLPRLLKCSEFEMLQQEAREQGHPGAQLMSTWYDRDDNAVPAVYVLQVHCVSS